MKDLASASDFTSRGLGRDRATIARAHREQPTGPDRIRRRGAAAVILALEDKLRESEERFESAFQQSRIGMAFVSLEGRWLKANARACSIVGYSEEELLARAAREITPPDDVETNSSRWRQMLAREIQNYTAEKLYIHKKGHLVRALMSVSLMRNRAGAPLYFICQIEDITGREEAEEALQTSRLQLAQAMELANLVNWEYDVAADQFTFDDRFYALYGTTTAREGGGRMSSSNYAREFVHPGDEEIVAAEIARALSTTDARHGRQFEHRIVRRDGQIRHIVVHMEVVRDADGQIVRYHGANQDITERKLAEEALRASQQIIEGIINAIPVRVFWKDANLVYLGCNAAFARDAGYADPKEIIGKDDYQMGWRDQAESYRRMDRQVIESGCSKLLIEEPQTTPEGHTITLLTSKLPLIGPGGEINGVLGTYMDITDQKILQTQLIQAQKLESIGQLAAGIAHEINTPTQYVADNTRFLKDAWGGLMRVIDKNAESVDGLASTKQGREAAEHLREVQQEEDLEYLTKQIPSAIDQSLDGLSRIASIVRAMKDFSHPDSDTASLSDINEAIQATVGVSRSEWKYVADLELALDPGLPLVPCHLGEFNQVILNLIVNAAHAIGDVARGSGKRGTITVTTRCTDGGMVEISVADTGTGIPEAEQGKVFDPFFTTKEVGKGTGQGLAIAHNVITNRHQGKIAFSTQEGVGTTFTILLPVEPKAGPKAEGLP